MNNLIANTVSNLSAAKNLHLTIQLVLTIGLSVAEIWAPEGYDAKFRATEKLLMSYGLLAAANSAPGNHNGRIQCPLDPSIHPPEPKL